MRDNLSLKKYEFHLHTKYSFDSNLEPKTVLKVASKRGLDGVAITDHNTIKGALEAQKLAKNYPEIDFIIGEEVKTNYGDVLVLGLQEEIPKKTDFFETVDKAREQDALLIIAHPSRFWPRHGFKGNIKKCFPKADAIEVLNGRSMWYENNIAKREALTSDSAITGGSDAHFSFEIGNCTTTFPADVDLKTALRKKLTRPLTGNYMIQGWLGNFCTTLRSARLIWWTK